MVVVIAVVLAWLLGAYAALGAVFAVAFLWRGIEALHPGPVGGGIALRLILLPGAVALWPVLAARWLGAGDDRPNP
jgi:hypothetical protein